MNMKNQIKEIIYQEFTKLINNLEKDFKKNYIKKANNFLLNQLDEKLNANLVFVSSFESKSGNAIEICAKKIARLKYGNDNVPSIVNPHNIEHNLQLDENKQHIITYVDISNSEFIGKVAEFRSKYEGSGNKQKSGVTQNTIKSLLEIANEYSDDKVHSKPVDLAFFDGEEWNVLELKAGGDLDSSNAPKNVEKILSIYAGLNVTNAKMYFATLYNKDGEKNTWSGGVKKHLSYPEMFLIGREFWEKILPRNITFDEFTEIYKEALNEIDLNTRINKMLEECVVKK